MMGKLIIIEEIKKQIVYLRESASNAGDTSDLIYLGEKIARLNIVISILEQEEWNDCFGD